MDEKTLHALEGRPRPLPLALTDAVAVDGVHVRSGGPNSPKLPPPAERILPSSSTSKTVDDGHAATASANGAVAGSSTRSQHSHSLSHARTQSLADLALQTKRLSLNFPPPSLREAGGTRSPRPLSFVGSPVLPPIQASPSPDKEVADSPTKDSFLTHIAAQERRVLELKEELSRAERELEDLKKQWAQHEVQRKKQDARRSTQLKSLHTLPSPALDSGNDSEDVDGSSNWMQLEMERRKQMLSGVQRSNRRVFSGSRHTRTLSLLSPERTQPPPFPQPVDAGSTADAAASIQPRQLVRSATTASLERPTRERQSADNALIRPSLDLTRLPSETILKTGRQMATDLKDGLWTFFEDIRQATVGEEAVSGQPTRRTQQGHVRSKTTHNLQRQGSRSSLGKSSTSSTRSGATARQDSRSPTKHHRAGTRQQRPMSDAFDIIGGDFWSANGFIDDSIGAHVVQPRNVRNMQQQEGRSRTPVKPSSQRPSSRDSEAWDTWDTPATKATTRPSGLATSPAADSVSSADNTSAKSTPRTSTSSAGAVTTNPAASSTPSQAHIRSPLAATSSNSRDAIPWPALAKLTPSNLKRTASNLMNEWEKTISPILDPTVQDTRSPSPSPIGLPPAADSYFDDGTGGKGL